MMPRKNKPFFKVPKYACHCGSDTPQDCVLDSKECEYAVILDIMEKKRTDCRWWLPIKEEK